MIDSSHVDLKYFAVYIFMQWFWKAFNTLFCYFSFIEIRIALRFLTFSLNITIAESFCWEWWKLLIGRGAPGIEFSFASCTIPCGPYTSSAYDI